MLTTATQEFVGQEFVGVVEGTRIRTPRGSRAVEDLVPGELVVTDAGIARPILWIGRKRVEPLRGDFRHGLPVRVCAAAFGQGPERDLLLSPRCALLVGGVLVEACALVNGTSVRREGGAIGAFSAFSLEFADQELILADGIAVESFAALPGRGTLDDEGFEESLPGETLFDNWPERLALRSEWEAGAELALPRARSARQVPRAVRALLGQGGFQSGSVAG